MVVQISFSSDCLDLLRCESVVFIVVFGLVEEEVRRSCSSIFFIVEGKISGKELVGCWLLELLICLKIKQPTKKDNLSSKSFPCHPERSEGSRELKLRALNSEILRFAQNDKHIKKSR